MSDHREEKYWIAASREGSLGRNRVYICVSSFLRYHAFVAIVLSLFSHAPHYTDHVISAEGMLTSRAINFLISALPHKISCLSTTVMCSF